jgi:hypothetical protein
MQIRAWAALEETSEFAFLPTFQKETLVTQWLREMVQDLRREGADVPLCNQNSSKPFQTMM